jgi:hypothetical protein
MGILAKLHAAEAELARRSTDPWQKTLEAAVQDMEAISTVALMELLGVPKTTGSARRIAKIMRSIGFVPIKSRGLMPGGFRDTIGRGWARPVREARLHGARIDPGDHAGTSHDRRVSP